jgi:membrane protein DedA with SNARE-associated domain
MIKIHLINLLIQYKYSILIPLGFIEGHIVSLASGFLAHQGYLNPVLAGICIAIGNLLGDIVLYWLGYYKGDRFINRYGKTFGITTELVSKGHELFHKHKSRVLMISKLTNGFGFAMAVLFSAGAMKIPFKKFLFWNVIGETLWTGLLISLGYFFGTAYTSIDSTMTKFFFIIVSLVLATFVFLKVRKIFINKFTQ